MSKPSQNKIALASWKRREKNRKWVYEYLLEHPCVDCGEENPVVLEFDHRADKFKKVSNHVQDSSLTALKREVEKCDVRCSNCHKIVTAIDFNWYSARKYYHLDD